MDESLSKLERVELSDVAQSLDFTCGAACFESMYRYFFNDSYGDVYFAELLGTLELGYTAPESIVRLAKSFGLRSELCIEATLSDLKGFLSKGAVIFVTWWDEDAGHYSLIKSIEGDHITLMDPWTARDRTENRLSLPYFLENWSLRGCKMIWVLAEQASATV